MARTGSFGNKKSGYTSLPPRVQIRELDNLKNKYGTILRTGDKDRQGKYSINFDDTFTHIFGKRIADDFSSSGLKNETILNQKKWQTTSENIIKEEVISITGLDKKERCFVFAGKGDSEGRWISTVEKIRNPGIVFTVIVGAHNNIKGGLNLTRPNKGTGLTIQASLDGNTWKDIKVITSNNNLKEFYNVGDDKFPIFPRKLVKLTTKDFSYDASQGSFYVRIIQKLSDYTNNFNPSWAISNIEIIASNQNITFPMVNNVAKSGMQVVNTTIAKPHTTSSINTTGRIVKGVSDAGYIDRDFNEQLEPFNEHALVSTSEYSFLQQAGTLKNFQDGFSTKFFHKTRIDVDLSPQEETKIGYINPHFGVQEARRSGDGQQLMVYWNNALKRWEKIAQPITFNNANIPHSEELTQDNLKNVLTSSAIGFSCLGIIASGSIDRPTNTTLLSKDAISSYVRPIDNFNFPFGGQYHATASQTLKARDLGINHPFLLEGTSLSFDFKLEIAGLHSDYGVYRTNTPAWQFGAPVTFNYLTHPSWDLLTDTNIKTIIPSFFMLRQFPCNFSHIRNQETVFGINNSSDTPVLGLNFSTSIEVPTGSIELVSGSQSLSSVSDKRELITYKQVTFITTGSNTRVIPNYEPRIKNALDPTYLLDQGLGRDKNVIIRDYNSSTGFSLTGSLNVSSRVKMGKTTADTVPYNISGSSHSFDHLLLGNSSCGRGITPISKSPRSLFNTFSAKDLNNETTHFIPNAAQNQNPVEVTIQKNSDIDLVSPYVIFPDDELILGWQYPLERFPGMFTVITSSISRNSMTLFKNAKLELYGSLIKHNKETHDTRNQNLTTSPVHEVVFEKDVDQYQIATRCEMTGSYVADRLIEYATTAFNAGLFPPGGFSILNVDSEISKIASSRIGKLVISHAQLANIPHISGTFDYYARALKGAGHYTPQLNRPSLYDNITSKMKGLNKFVKLTSENLFYKDNGEPLTYYYDYRNFGNKFNLIRGSKDSNITFTKTNNKSDFTNILGAAINVIFVDSINAKCDPVKVKVFNRGNINDLLDYVSFQSSNISTTCTSSLPFIDDNTPRNRIYITGSDDLIAVTA